jgi:hypothetical protein
MIGDLLANINNGLAATTLNTTTNAGASASFAWWPTYTWAAPTSGGSGGPVANGTYKIVNRNSGLAFEVLNATTTNGSQIDQYTYFGGNHQRWTLTDLGGGVYKIIGVASGRAVDVNGASTANGAKVQLWDYSGGANQKYTLASQGSGFYRMTPTHATGSCIEVAGMSSSTGALVQQWSWLGNNGQQWSFQAP